MAAVGEALIDLAAEGGELRIDELAVSTADGEARLRLDASLDSGDPDPINMLRRAYGTASLRVPVALASALAAVTPDGDRQLRTAVGMGVLRRDGSDYVSDIRYEKGRLEVNGAPVPLPF